MYWANFLHIYQPPTQKPHWVKRITEESYRRIVEELLRAPTAKLTLNVNACLLELLEQHGCGDIIDGVRELLKRGQVELTGSAKFHPLLPTLDESEMIRQIELSDETLHHYFGDLYQRRGFFPPEMGFSVEVAAVAKKLGFAWVIVDELSFQQQHGAVDYSKIYRVDGLGDLAIFFRERRMSYKILSGQLGTGELLIKSLGDRLKKHEYLLTAMDGETFGHHRPGMEHLLFEIYKSKMLQTVLISELSRLFKATESIAPLPSTWALMEKDLEKNAPFSRWQDPANAVHGLQWELTRLAIDRVHASDANAPGFPQARQALDRALHSDQYWWASAKPWWSLEMIEAGAKDLREVIERAPASSADDRRRAVDLYQRILETGFTWQRNGTVENLAHQEDEEIRQRTDEGLPKLPKKEIDKMVVNLEKEMRLVAGRQEFERAAQLRDRIKELRQYADETPGRD